MSSPFFLFTLLPFLSPHVYHVPTFNDSPEHSGKETQQFKVRKVRLSVRKLVPENSACNPDKQLRGAENRFFH
ncbi:hypothetical protein F2P81_018677 [Scophthalmus maximus]|uniref:Secreted protein n=1 Tax=Scophthalmus maximus TaxID=52904 RepID=A0A6A4SGR6_SCOMX|nr:hypothetical protein F2P81_018677 [Scophthalmus maximus]